MSNYIASIEVGQLYIDKSGESLEVLKIFKGIILLKRPDGSVLEKDCFYLWSNCELV